MDFILQEKQNDKSYNDDPFSELPNAIANTNLQTGPSKRPIKKAWTTKDVKTQKHNTSLFMETDTIRLNLHNTFQTSMKTANGLNSLFVVLFPVLLLLFLTCYIAIIMF